jgi:hypothetical protein
MSFKRSGVFAGRIALAIFIIACSGLAETQRISIFRGVDIPFDFKSGDIVVDQGKYDLDVHFSKVDTIYLYLLKFMRKGKVLYEISGQRIEYQAQTISELSRDPKIPKEPTIRIRKLPGGNLVDFIFESGKTGNMPFEKAFFRVEQIQK